MAPVDDPQTLTATRHFPRLASGLVRVVDGPDRGRRHYLKSEPVVVGSSREAGLRLTDPKVSRKHCEITLGAFGFLVHDLGSRNGTFFEGSRVSEVALPPGAIVKIGDTYLALSPEDDASSVPASQRTSFGAMVGSTLAMRRIYTLLERAAACDATVLLGGETGTGKELAARAIHDGSARAGRPYEVFDCGAVPATLLQAELFGHEKGAFTGAVSARAGVFERGQGGTVFLDEIAEIPLDLQPALLRVCESGEIRRVGGNAASTVNVRLIAATRKDLATEVVAGRFREDLYYRLAVLPIELPALRNRRDDLPVLCKGILRDLGVVDPGPIEGPGLAALMEHDWPGNVRELRNVLERAVVLAGGPAPFATLPLGFAAASAPTSSRAGDAGAAAAPLGFQERKAQHMAEFERKYLADLMAEHIGNIKRASRASGIERTQLKRLLRKNGLL